MSLLILPALEERAECDELERYSVIRALAAIRRCDVALLVIDATRRLLSRIKDSWSYT